MDNNTARYQYQPRTSSYPQFGQMGMNPYNNQYIPPQMQPMGQLMYQTPPLNMQQGEPQIQTEQPVSQATSDSSSNDTFIWVENEFEASMYPVSKGASLMFMNRYQPIVYKKYIDENNTLTFKAYDLVERELSMPLGDNSTYATKADLESLQDQIGMLVQNLSQITTSLNNTGQGNQKPRNVKHKDNRQMEGNSNDEQ